MENLEGGGVMSTFGEGVEVYGKLAKVIQRFRCDRPNEWTMDEFIREAQKLQKENDELKTSLRSYENMVSNRICYTTKELSKLKADAIREAVDNVIPYDDRTYWDDESSTIKSTKHICGSKLKRYADKLEQDNE